jgi:hypothetical protein
MVQSASVGLRESCAICINWKSKGLVDLQDALSECVEVPHGFCQNRQVSYIRYDDVCEQFELFSFVL